MISAVPHRAGRPAFTLIEMMISLTIIAFIMAACGSMVMLAAKAMSNDASNAGSNATASRSAVDMIIDDLKVATAVTEQTATAITMTVPDRDGDASPETIRYSWTGTPGDPLKRAYNTRPAGVVAANVQALNFSYLTKTVGKPPPVESAEQLHAGHETAISGNITTAQISSTQWAAESFKPILSSTAIAWTVTRCRVGLRRAKTSIGSVDVVLRYTDSNGNPTGANLAAGSVVIANVLSTGTNWVDVVLSPKVSLDTSKTVCLQLSSTNSTTIGNALVDSVATDTSIKFLNTSNGGTSWLATSSNAMFFYAWGTVTTQETETTTFQPLPPAQP